ncbi:DMT family transporter [Egicoccus sp. AB-alg2]|uniref:EamA family transporter n=1 Tax=Egicoccus sp. AB-alg2 TaxID=3242693 RepID=UPI00359DC372
MTSLDAPARTTRFGLPMALVSAFTFGSSGPMAKALIDTGWTAGAAVLVRLGGSAIVLGVVAAILQRGRLRLSSASLRTLVAYGVVAMAGAQLSFFNAVRTLDVGVALLLEFTAPVLLVLWTAARTRRRPPAPTLIGAALTMVGLGFVLDLAGAGGVDPAGVAWGLLAAVCLAAFFVLSERQHDDLPPIVMAAGGTAIGAGVIALTGLLGIVPLGFAAADVTLAGNATTWLLPALWLVLVSTSIAYLTGIGAVRRLGTRSASFVALTEVLFAALVAWALLAQVPGPSQVVGGICIITGIVVVRRTEATRAPAAPETTLEPGHAL